mmetsp:Transcript_16275/g.36599  ORF Transcript_16275/g.36599 Transcript_16275/m.36599 type:complete len:204 (+) Transcript_16275:1923-2534(+)
MAMALSSFSSESDEHISITAGPSSPAIFREFFCVFSEKEIPSPLPELIVRIMVSFSSPLSSPPLHPSTTFSTEFGWLSTDVLLFLKRSGYLSSIISLPSPLSSNIFSPVVSVPIGMPYISAIRPETSVAKASIIILHTLSKPFRTTSMTHFSFTTTPFHLLIATLFPTLPPLRFVVEARKDRNVASTTASFVAVRVVVTGTNL